MKLNTLLKIRVTLIFVSSRVNGDIFTTVENILGSVSEGTIDDEKIRNKRAIDVDAVIADSYEVKMYPIAIPIKLKINAEIKTIPINE